MDEELSLPELENSFIEDLNNLNDRLLQYEYLLALSADMPYFTPDERTEAHKVRGCQSGVWLILEYSGGKVRVRADSDALIIRGILSIVVSLLDGRTPEEITAYKPRFIEETNIKKQLSADRFRGIHSVVGSIQAFASAPRT